jgi:mannose-6-phosphate isomerase-like protein (cupin superfamily)
VPTLIKSPTVVEAAGNKPKKIEEFVGRMNCDESRLSVARMTSPEGWEEPGQTPEFAEISLVLAGRLHIDHKDGTTVVEAGQAILVEAGEWIRYHTPDTGGAEYIGICLPAFSMDTVHRDDE